MKADLIQSRLTAAFSPTYLEVIDESHQHAGHAGFQKDGSHFAIVIAADCFKNLSRVAAHQKIYAALSDLIPEQIHALRIQVK